MNDDDYLLIDDYLHQRLDGEATAAFQQRLAREPELAEALEFAQLTHRYLDEKAEEERFRAELRQARPPAKQVLPWRRYGPVAAAVAAAAALLLWWAPWRSDLYESYARHPPLALVQMSDNAPTVAAAEAAFNDGHYEEAASLLALLQAAAPDNGAIRLYRGIALLELDRTVEARASLEPLAGGRTALRNEALFYLALAAVKEEDYAAARTHLRGIPANSSRYEAAQELLNRLP